MVEEKSYGKRCIKYDVSDEVIEAWRLDNIPMPPYRITEADSAIQKGWFLHFGVMDIPESWAALSDKASTVNIDITTKECGNFRPIVRRYMKADTDTKIKMMNKIKHLLKNGIVKTADIFRSMSASNDIVEVEEGKTMARNTFYMYANQARMELIKNGT